MLTDYLVTYTPSGPGGIQLEVRLPGNTTAYSIQDLEPGMEYNINVYAVLNNTISVPTNTIVSTCEYGYICRYSCSLTPHTHTCLTNTHTHTQHVLFILHLTLYLSLSLSLSLSHTHTHTDTHTHT